MHIRIHIIHIGIHYHENNMSFGRCENGPDAWRWGATGSQQACGARTMRPSQAMDHDIFAAG